MVLGQERRVSDKTQLYCIWPRNSKSTDNELVCSHDEAINCPQVWLFASHYVMKVTQNFLVTHLIDSGDRWSMTISFVYVEGIQEYSSLFTNELLPLKQLYHSFICVVPVVSSPNTYWILWIVSTWESPSLKQHLMQLCCSTLCHLAQKKSNGLSLFNDLPATVWFHSCEKKLIRCARYVYIYAHPNSFVCLTNKN